MVAPIQSPAKCEVRSVMRFLNAKGERPAEIHPPYSPDLAPSDFHLFLHLEEHLVGKNFDDNYEVQEEVMTFKGQVADFYDSGIQKLVPRLNKCLDNAGDSVEK
jgi:histone-lysine N-methyltransferase SETMAR